MLLAFGQIRQIFSLTVTKITEMPLKKKMHCPESGRSNAKFGASSCNLNIRATDVFAFLSYSGGRPLFTVVQQGPFFCRVQDVKEDSLLLGLKSRANGREIASHALFFAATWAIKGNWRENSSNGTKDREVSDVLKKIAKRIANNFQYRS